MRNPLIEQESATLTQLRSLIGGLHQSNGSGKTPDYPVYQVNHKNLVTVTTMALAALHDALRWASYMYVMTNNHPSNDRSLKRHAHKLCFSKEAFAFIAGTGLDVMIESYGLAYDAEEIRASFYNMFHIPEET